MFRLGAIFTLLLGIFSSYYSIKLGLGQVSNPGPGFWPFVLSLVIAIASILSLIFEKDLHFEGFSRDSRYPVFAIISLGIFISLFNTIGFLIPAFALLLYWLRFLGKESWKLSIVISIAITCSFYLLFAYFLEIPFPEELLF